MVCLLKRRIIRGGRKTKESALSLLSRARKKAETEPNK
jgi:hypothetical protein